MKIGILTTTHIRSNAALGSLRLLVDSARSIPRDQYEHFLVVDDCSPTAPAGAYYEHLERTGIASVYRLGPERIPYWGPKHGMAAPDGVTTFGHAHGLMAGFWRLSQLGCTHAWVIDSDCVIMKPGSLQEAVRLLASTGAVVATDWYGGSPDAGAVQTIDTFNHYRTFPDGRVDVTDRSMVVCGGGRRQSAWYLFGFPVLFCAVVDLTKEPLYGLLDNAGWVNSKWGQRLLRKGEKVVYYPFFQDGAVFHLGLGFTSPNINSREFGNAVTTRSYGGKEYGYRYAGSLQLNRPHEEHLKWLEERGALPVDQETPPSTIKRWLVSPKEQKLTREQRYLRTLQPHDFEALCRIDSDPETTRFLSWGPHGPDQTRAFLDRALAARKEERWWALSKDNGELLGYGEIRRLPHIGPTAAGFVYVISPKHRRQGHGIFLLEELLRAATAALDCDLCEVAIDAENHASLATLKKRHDFNTDWKHSRTEDYMLKGSPSKRNVYTRLFPITPELPPATLEECRLYRERFLFEQRGMWRP